MRLLGIAASLSVLAAGLVGLAATYLEAERTPVSVAQAAAAPEGSRVLVRGLLGDIRPVSGGGAVSTLSDCAGGNLTVLFESSPPSRLSWRLVDLDGRATRYKGAPELSVGAGASAREAPVPFSVVDGEALLRDFRG